MALAVFGGAVVLSIVGRNFDLDDLRRDVVIRGSEDRLVPGTIDFEVLEPLGDSSSSGDMYVGVAIPSGAAPEPECTITATDASEVLSAPARSDDVLARNGNARTDTVLAVARLEPGAYTAECLMAGEPSAASGVSFTVGRVFRPQEVFDEFGAVIGAIAVVGIAGLLFLLGLVLLIVGFVARSRARKAPQPPYPGFPYPPGQYPPGPYPQGQYPPGQPYPGQAPYPGEPQAPYPQPPYPQPPYPGQPEYPQPEYPQPEYPQPEPPAPQPWTPPPSAPPSPPPSGPPTVQPGTPPEDHGDSGWTIPPSKR